MPLVEGVPADGLEVWLDAGTHVDATIQQSGRVGQGGLQQTAGGALDGGAASAGLREGQVREQKKRKAQAKSALKSDNNRKKKKRTPGLAG